MKKVLGKLLIGLAVAVAIFGGMALFKAWYDRKAPNFSGDLDLYVYPWMDADAVRDSIVASGIVKNTASLERVLKNVDEVAVGHYRIRL